MKISHFNRLAQLISALLCVISLTACVTTSSPVDKVVQVSLSHDNGTVSPNYYYREEVIIKGDLSTEWSRRGYDNKNQQRRRGNITPEQLQTLKDLIQQSNYMQVHVPKQLPKVGGSGGGISIETNLGHRRFNLDTMPEGVTKVASYVQSLSPE